MLSTSHFSQDNLRLLKSIHQGNSENLIETIKNGIHVEFKLSTEIEQTNQKIQLNEQKSKRKIFFCFEILIYFFSIIRLVALFDLQKPEVNVEEDIITLTQNKCKLLLAETKQKMFDFQLSLFLIKYVCFLINRLETMNDQNMKHPKKCRVGFYGDNSNLRKKNNAFNQSNRLLFY